MADTDFTDNSTVIEASWLNAINDFFYTLFAGATSAANARTAISAAKSGANTDITSLSAPALGAATATTQSADDNSTAVATTAYVDTAVTGFYGFSTGDVKLTIKTTADSGWVMCNDGTIGNAASGGTTRANADTEDLFTLLWTNVSDSYAAVSSGRGGSAAADYAANKTIALTKSLGRVLGVSGSGSGLTARTLGQTVGEETHTISVDEMPAHTHTGGIGSFSSLSGAGSNATPSSSDSAATGSAGGSTAHNLMQPTVFLQAMIKL